MRDDLEQIKEEFDSINLDLNAIASKIEDHLVDILKDVLHIDKIGCRVKGKDSFIGKTQKEKDGVLKYKVPLKEIQDLIGARVVVYYKSDVDSVDAVLSKYFKSVEQNIIVPDDVTKFGYEGKHYIYFIPNTIYSSHKANLLIPDFFELQIKTLFQHAWSQAEHGLGYKPGNKLSYEEERKLAFIAAQSWGADTMLMDLISNKS